MTRIEPRVDGIRMDDTAGLSNTLREAGFGRPSFKETRMTTPSLPNYSAGAR